MSEAQFFEIVTCTVFILAAFVILQDMWKSKKK
jgi:hypothetical protein